jgi:glutaminyl-tRNA synthetase
METPPKKFFRLAPGQEVRLRYGYFIRCDEVVKDAAGEVVELRCSYDPGSRGGNAPDGRKVKGTIHWVSAKHAVLAEAKLYDHLFIMENPGDIETDYKNYLNPNSLIVQPCYIEPSIATAKPGDKFQFERQGYFCADNDSTSAKPVFNRTVSLKDSWSKTQQQNNNCPKV